MKEIPHQDAYTTAWQERFVYYADWLWRVGYWRRPEVTGAIVGARRPDQVEDSIGAADFRLSNEELSEIENRGLLTHGR